MKKIETINKLSFGLLISILILATLWAIRIGYNIVIHFENQKILYPKYEIQANTFETYLVDSYTIENGCVKFQDKTLCGSFKILSNY